MKTIILIASTCLFSSWAFASSDSSSVYVKEAGIVSITGKSAMQLYNHVDAKEENLVLVTHQQQREKQNGAVRCVATFLGGFDENQDGPGRYTMVDAECTIILPQDSVQLR